MTDFNQKTHDTDVGSHGGQSRQMMEVFENQEFGSIRLLQEAELRFPSATMSFSRRSGSAGLAFRHKALPIWRKPHFLCLQRIISGNTRFVR